MSNEEAGTADRESESEPQRPSRPLTPWERFTAGLFGFLMAGVGATAVFMRDVEAGPTALIAIGAVLLVMSVTGSPITRAKFGDNEVTLAARREAVARIAASEPEEVAPAIAVMEAYDPGSTRSTTVRRIEQDRQERRNFDSWIGSVLDSEYGDSLKVHPRSSLGASVDFAVTYSGQEIAIEWLYSQRDTVSYPLFKNKVQQLLDSDYSTGLLVSNVSIPSHTQEREIARAARFGNRIQILAIDQHSRDPQALLDALKELATT
ncbi:hypothetical protein [Streptomyces sp. NPDC001068]|uniref:hypothetical protein n=1 Tax=Streptomyces sp. NPDC001068 TaxID=3364544 RepID=UPI003686B85F